MSGVAPLVPGPPVPGLGRLGAVLGRLAEVPHLRGVIAPSVATREEGVAAVDRLVDEGAGMVLLEDGGPDGPATAVAAALLDLEPVTAVGTAAGPGWAELVTAVRDGLRVARGHRGDVPATLDALGAPELAGAAALIVRCAERRTPVLLSGATGVCVAALVAHRLAPGAASWCVATQTPTGPAATRALAAIPLEALLDLGISGPGGAGLALALLQAADRSRLTGDAPDAPA